MRSRLTTTLFALGVALLAGCATPAHKQARTDNPDILTADTILKPAPPTVSNEGVTGISIAPEAQSNRPPPKPEIEVGTGKFFKVQPSPRTAGGEGQVTFNFENQPIQAVVKAILGDMLQENYTIAPNVGGTVTFAPRRFAFSHSASVLSTWTYGSQNECGTPGGDFITPPALIGSPLAFFMPGRSSSV